MGQVKNDANVTMEIGNSLHTDWNLLTMVWTDLVGFEVLYEDKYYKVEETGNRYLICNCGDFLSSLTKGKLRSPWHQVIQPRNGVRN